MARTKAQAKKSTGGNAPRRALGRGVAKAGLEGAAAAGTSLSQELRVLRSGGPVRTHAAAGMGQSKAAPASPVGGPGLGDGAAVMSQSTDSSEAYCHVCCDGSQELVLCDLCTRVMCSKHLGGLPNQFDISLYDFVCMVCHEDNLGKILYRAFYISTSPPDAPQSWVPVLVQPVTLSAEYSLSTKSHISNTSTLILHLCLDGLQNTSLPPYQVELVLKEYLNHPLLNTIEQPYDFTDGIDVHEANVNEWVEAVSSYDRVVVFITTHANDDTGDLYGGPAFSSDPYQVLKALFPQSLRQAFKGRQVYLNLLVCGGFADTPSARTALFKASRKIHATEAIAFSSAGLIPSLTNGFWLDFATRVLIEGFGLRDAMPYMLAATSTSSFVRHTNLIYAQVPKSKDQAVICHEYLWTHPKLRPFGRRLPANCVACGCMGSFGSPIKLTPKTGTKYVFVCQGTDNEGEICLHELRIEPIEGFEPFGQAQNGARWMVRTVSTLI